MGPDLVALSLSRLEALMEPSMEFPVGSSQAAGRGVFLTEVLNLLEQEVEELRADGARKVGGGLPFGVFHQHLPKGPDGEL